MGDGGPLERGGEKGAPPLKRRYFTAIGLSGVKMIADRHKNAAYHNKHWRRTIYLEMSTLMTLNNFGISK